MAIRVWFVGVTFFLISACGEVPPGFSSATERTGQKAGVEVKVEAKDEAREKAAGAQKQFQQEIYEMMASRWAHLEPLLKIHRDNQIARSEAGTLRFYFLLRNHPEKIVRDKGISAFLNFEWSEEDEERLRKTSGEYRKLQGRIDELRRLSDGNRLWPEAREKFALFSKEEDYKAALNRLNEAFREVRESLGSKE